MNMSTSNRNSMGMPTAPMSTVLNPLVRVTLWNTEVVTFPNHDIPSIVPCHSSAANVRVPKATRINEK